MKRPSYALLLLACGVLVSCNGKSGKTTKAGIDSKIVKDTDVGWEHYVLRASLTTPSDKLVIARLSQPEAKTYCWYSYNESGFERLNTVPAEPAKVKQQMETMGKEVANVAIKDQIEALAAVRAFVFEPIDLQPNKYGPDTPSELLASLANKIALRFTVAAMAVPGTAASAVAGFSLAKWKMQRACDLANPQKCESIKPSVAQLALLASVLQQSDEDQLKKSTNGGSGEISTCAEPKE